MAGQDTQEILFCERFWRNRKGEAVVVELRVVDGFTLCDVRQFFTAPDGKLRPTKSGVAIAIRKLPELRRAIDKAARKAADLGLIEKAAADE